MRFVEPWWLKTTAYTVPLGLAGGKLRLLHLSDFHADPMPLEYLAKSVRAGIALKPDLICVTGDFITERYDQWDAYSALLAELPKAAPTFATLGNHDGGRWARHSGYADTNLTRELLARAKIPLLHNRLVPFEHPGGRLMLAGLGDWWADEMDAATAFRGHTRRADVPTVLLSHNPDTKDELLDQPWDLMLSGHTHGGQLSLPFVGEPFAPVRDKRYVRDLHQLGDRWLHITAGVGCLHTARFNCRPEISLLTLV
jgi:predicted MPP superfamily phosphohydrolase